MVLLMGLMTVILRENEMVVKTEIKSVQSKGNAMADYLVQ